MSQQKGKITIPEEQKVIDISKDSKSVRLDVYLKDEKGTVYNVEIQTTSNRNLPKRTRFYQGMIDLNAIEKGADYSDLTQSFVIFICTFDAFGKGRWRYTFESVCKEDLEVSLNDETYKIFFNTVGIKGSISKDTKNILRFIENNTAEGVIRGVVETYKEVGFSFQETVKRVAEKFDFSLQRSEEEVNKYWI